MSVRSSRVRALFRRWRDAWAGVLALAAAVCMALSAYHFRPVGRALEHFRPTAGGPQDYFAPSAPWWGLVGALLLVIALALARRLPESPAHRAGPPDALRPRWAWVLVAPGGFLLLLLAEANGQWIGWTWLQEMAPTRQLALFGAGIALVVLGLGGLPGRGRPPEDVTPTGEDTRPAAARTEAGRTDTARISPAREIVLLLVLALVALGVRFYQLGGSIHVLVDEVHFVLGVNYARFFPDLTLLTPMPTTASFPFIFSYGQALLVDVFGRNLLGVRALSAIFGALTVPAVYLLGRELFDRTTALVAALVLLTFPPHLHYSRLALNNIADPLFGTLALACIARGLRTRSRTAWALAGVFLGLAQYFYEGGRLIYPVLAATWLAGGFVLWRPRPPLRGVLILLVAFVLVAAPLYYTFLGVDFPLTDRMDKATYTRMYWDREREANNFETRVRHFMHASLHLVNAPENTVFHYYLYYGGAHPLIQEWLVPWFLLGVVIALWRWRRVAVLLPLWVAATLAGNALLVESAVTARYVVAFPALALLIALGLRGTLALVAGVGTVQGRVLRDLRARRRLARAASVLAVLLGAVFALGQAYYYFGPHLTRFNEEVRSFPTADGSDALLRSVDFPHGTMVHLVGGRVLPQRDAQHFMDYLADGVIVAVHEPQDITPEYLHSLERHHDHAFYVEPQYADVLALLAETFGARPVQETANPLVTKSRAMLLYYLPAAPGVVGPPAAG